MDSGYDTRRKKLFHRHSPRQIQTLEATFQECPHPDEKQRMRLSRELGLNPRQIKFWFQNRRTQMKAQNERADNSSLRVENERIRCENFSMKEALRRVVCPNCGCVPEDASLDEDQLRLENARLRDELQRISNLASRKLGGPVHKMIPMSSLSLSVGEGQNSVISLEQRSSMVDDAAAAVEELIKLVQAEEPLWSKLEKHELEILNAGAYESIFTRAKDTNMRREASRASCVAMISPESLVEALIDTSKWVELFPTIVSKAKTIEVLSSGVGGNGSLQLVYAEVQALSPIVAPREFFFLRHSRQIDRKTWVVADISAGSPPLASPCCRKLPSGCVIQDMFNGFSKIIWVEHSEVLRSPIHRLYKNLVEKGVAFGAQRWAAALRRSCERAAFAAAHGGDSEWSLSGEGKANLVKLAERMVSNFCGSVFAGDGDGWTTTLSGQDDGGVRVAVHRSVDPGQPNGVVLSAATSVWLPTLPEIVFGFLSNARTRFQWDVLSCGNPVQEVAHISTGQDLGNGVSLLRGLNGGESSMLILQESSTSAWGSSVVYAPIDVSSVNVVVNGQGLSRVPLLPSGFSIVPGEDEFSGKKGALVTVAFQILVSSLPSSKMNMESVGTVKTLISTTVRQIKAALNCPPSAP
ncbi:homeobox-leucine zipper protein ROC8-like isoform X2 [Wolffia australiana]